MADFSAYYPKLLKHEGGYASPAYAAKMGDSGGETYLGIARNYNKDWAGWKIVDEYKKAHGEPKYNSRIPDVKLDKLAEDLSKKLYWDKLNLDLISNQSLAEQIMDFGYNSGLGTSAKAVNALVGFDNKKIIDKASVEAINKADTTKVFNGLQDYRVNLIQKSSKIDPKNKPGLLKRAKSFVYDNKGTIVKVAGIGFFFWILAVIIVLGIYYYNNKK